MMTLDRKMPAVILRMSLPVMIGMISTTVLNLVDTAMVGRLGDVPLAAVGLASFFMLVTVLVFGSLGVGTQAVTSRRLGEERVGEFPAIAFSSAIQAFAVGMVVSVLGYFLSGSVFRLMSDDPALVSVGTPYLAIRFVGIFAIITIFALRGFVFGLGRVRIDMAVSVVINVLNIFLNWLLIFGNLGFPRLEVRGAAAASVISTLVGLAVYILFVRYRILGRLGTVSRGPVMSGSVMWLIARISAPRAVQSLSVTGFVVFLSLIGRIGISELAISNIIFKAFNLAFMIGMAVGTASATLVGKSIGEGNSRRAEAYGWYSAAIGALLMGAIGLLFMLFPRGIMSMFTGSPETVEKGVLPFRVLGAFQFIDGIGIVLSRILQGAGSTMYVMMAEILCVWAVMIPVAWLAVEKLGGGLLETWMSLFIYIVFFAAAMVWKFREGGWKKIEI